jgi:hypothetical protein
MKKRVVAFISQVKNGTKDSQLATTENCMRKEIEKFANERKSEKGFLTLVHRNVVESAKSV